MNERAPVNTTASPRFGENSPNGGIPVSPGLGASEVQIKINRDIEAFIKKTDAAGEKYSEKDIEFINQYEGWGGQGKASSGEGLLYEFFTPDYIVDLMWKLAYRYGYDGGSVLEPSIATGRLIRPAPDKSKCVGFEINPTSARIAQITFPEATIHNSYFETAFLQPPRYTVRVPNNQLTWLKEYPFSLVIGNPPYGKYKNKYSSYFTEGYLTQIELYFMYFGLRLLKQNGLLVYITSSNFLRNGNTYNKAKEQLENIAEFVDAYRTPPVFRFSQVPTDIIVLRKK